MNEKLTAYALNELPPDERAELEAQMKTDPALREQAEEMKAFCAMLSEQVAGDESPVLTPQQRVSVMRAFNDDAAGKKAARPFWRHPALLIPAVITACVVGMLVRVDQLEKRTPMQKEDAGRSSETVQVASAPPAPKAAAAPAEPKPKPAPAAPAKPQIAAAPLPALPPAPATVPAPMVVADAAVTSAQVLDPRAVVATATAPGSVARLAAAKAPAASAAPAAATAAATPAVPTAPGPVAAERLVASVDEMLFSNTSGVIEFSTQLGQYTGGVSTRSAEGRDFPMDFDNRYSLRQSEWTVSKVDDEPSQGLAIASVLGGGHSYAAARHLHREIITPHPLTTLTAMTGVGKDHASQISTWWGGIKNEMGTLDTNIIGGVSGATGIVKTGGGTWVLKGANTDTGATVGIGGTLSVGGDATPDSLGATALLEDRYEPAMTPAKGAKVQEVQRHLQRGYSHLNLGDYDKSVASFQDALRVDPYNADARRGLERVEDQRSAYFAFTRENTRARILSEVNRSWEDAAPALLAETDKGSALVLGGSKLGGSLELSGDSTADAISIPRRYQSTSNDDAIGGGTLATVTRGVNLGNSLRTIDSSGTGAVHLGGQNQIADNSIIRFDAGLGGNAAGNNSNNSYFKLMGFNDTVGGISDYTAAGVIESVPASSSRIIGGWAASGREFASSGAQTGSGVANDSGTTAGGLVMNGGILRYPGADATTQRSGPVISANRNGETAVPAVAQYRGRPPLSQIRAMQEAESAKAGPAVAGLTTEGIVAGQTVTGTGVPTGTLTRNAGATATFANGNLVKSVEAPHLGTAGGAGGVLEKMEGDSLSSTPATEQSSVIKTGAGRLMMVPMGTNSYGGGVTIASGGIITGAGAIPVAPSASEPALELQGNLAANNVSLTKSGDGKLQAGGGAGYKLNIAGTISGSPAPADAAKGATAVPSSPSPTAVTYQNAAGVTGLGTITTGTAVPATTTMAPATAAPLSPLSLAQAPAGGAVAASTYSGTTTVNQGTLRNTSGNVAFGGTINGNINAPAQSASGPVVAGKDVYYKRDALGPQAMTYTESRSTPVARDYTSDASTRLIRDGSEAARGGTIDSSGTGGLTIANANNPAGAISGNRSGSVPVVPDSIDGLLVITTPATPPAPGTVPILGDIPVTGRLFTVTESTADRRRRENEALAKERDAIERVQELNRQRELALQRRMTSGESYTPIYENPFLFVEQQPLSTFSIDVDTASYANIRRFLNDGDRPPVDAVRLEELINYFPYTYEGPVDGKPFGVMVDVAESPWQPLHRLVRVAIKGREMPQERVAANFVFLVDVSGSMDSPDKLPLVQRSLEMLTRQLNATDRVAIVTYAGTSGLALPSTAGTDKNTILTVIDGLRAGGSTNGASGITLAYGEAAKHFVQGGVNRVILCTDGDFNVGISSREELEKLIAEKAKSRIFLSVLGFGTGNLQDSKMETLADKGNGNYAYIDSLSEARKVLVEQMNGTLVTIAKDVKIQVEFNPTQVAAYRLLGYENRLMAKEDFNNDKKDAGEIGAGHTVTALYEVVPANLKFPDGRPAVDELKYASKPKSITSLEPAPGGVASPAAPAAAAPSQEMMTVKLRYKQPEGDKSDLLEVPVTDKEKKLADSPRDFQFAASVAGFGMLLRGSQYGGDLSWDMVRELALKGKGEDPQGYRGEFLQLLDKARGVTEQRK